MEILLRDTPRYLNLYESFKDAPIKLAFKFLKLFGNLDIVQITYYGKLDDEGYLNTTIYLKLVY